MRRSPTVPLGYGWEVKIGHVDDAEQLGCTNYVETY